MGVQRTRWFRAETRLSLERLAEALRRHPFQEDSSEGFRLTRVRRISLEGSFFRKEEYLEEVVDPFGRPQNAPRVEYRETQFVIRSTAPELEVINPARGFSNFLTRLNEVSGFDFAATPLVVSVLDWATLIENALNRNVRFAGATVSSLDYGVGVIGRLTIASRATDIRESLFDGIAGRAHVLDRIQLAVVYAGKTEQITVSTDGTLRSTRDLPAELTELLRHSIPMTKGNSGT